MCLRPHGCTCGGKYFLQIRCGIRKCSVYITRTSIKTLLCLAPSLANVTFDKPTLRYIFKQRRCGPSHCLKHQCQCFFSVFIRNFRNQFIVNNVNQIGWNIPPDLGELAKSQQHYLCRTALARRIYRLGKKLSRFERSIYRPCGVHKTRSYQPFPVSFVSNP